MDGSDTSFEYLVRRNRLLPYLSSGCFKLETFSRQSLKNLCQVGDVVGGIAASHVSATTGICLVLYSR